MGCLGQPVAGGVVAQADREADTWGSEPCTLACARDVQNTADADDVAS